MKEPYKILKTLNFVSTIYNNEVLHQKEISACVILLYIKTRVHILHKEAIYIIYD